MSGSFFDYMARIQYMMQQGRFVADVLYYYGDHVPNIAGRKADDPAKARSEEHTSELQSLMRISYAVFCLKKKHKTHNSCTDIHLTHIYNNTLKNSNQKN